MDISKKLKPCLRLGIENTWRCNWSCKHCFYLRNSQFKTTNDIPFEALINKIEDGIERGCNHVVFVGYGEPTIAPGFQEVLKYCKSENIPTSIITNGASSLDVYNEAFQNGLNHIHLSFHGIGSVIENITKSSMAHEKQLSLRRWLKEREFSWRSNTVIQKENLYQLTEIVEEAIKYKVSHFVFLNFLPHYEWAKANNLIEQALHPKVIGLEIERASEMLIETNTMFTIRYFPFCYIDSKYWKYIVNSYYVAYDPWEWEYGLKTKTQEQIANNLRSHVEIETCKDCLAYQHCAGWNKDYNSAHGDIVRHITGIPDEYKAAWDTIGGIFIMNPANNCTGTI